MNEYKEYTVKVYPDHTEWRNVKGQLHRENDLPAVEQANGTKYWYKNGQCHRENGPAIEWHDGIQSWYLEGKGYSERDFKNEIQKRKSPPTCENKIVEIDGIKYQLKAIGL